MYRQSPYCKIALALFSGLSIFYLSFGKGPGLFSQESAFFFAIFIIYLSTFKLIEKNELSFIFNSLFVFVIFEFLVALGELSNQIIGIGFKVNAYYYSLDEVDAYLNAISGSFFNPNDLGSSCAFLFVLFIFLLKEFPLKSKIGIILCFILVLLSASRASILFVILTSLIFLYRILINNIIILFIFLFSNIMVLLSFSNFFNEFEFANRIISRIVTLYLFINGDALQDHSVNIRFESYMNFIYNIPVLKFGSFKYQEYHEFFNDLPSGSLFATNPHSFIIEIGYWLGWPGILLFFMFIFLTRPVNKYQYYYIIFSFLILSMISSSIINNLIFFMIFFSLLAVTCRENLKS